MLKNLHSNKVKTLQAPIPLFLGLILVSQCLTGCHPTRDVVSQEDTLFRIKAHETVYIQLEACLTCGYDWFLEPGDTMAIKLVSKSSQPKNPDFNIVGGNATETWKFIALQTGDHLLVFNYKRPWEEEIEKTKTIRIVVTN